MQKGVLNSNNQAHQNFSLDRWLTDRSYECVTIPIVILINNSLLGHFPNSIKSMHNEGKGRS